MPTLLSIANQTIEIEADIIGNSILKMTIQIPTLDQFERNSLDL